MIPRVMLAVALLQVGPPMPDKSNVMTLTQRDTLLLQWGLQPNPVERCCFETSRYASDKRKECSTKTPTEKTVGHDPG
jgi:hypothetical protein